MLTDLENKKRVVADLLTILKGTGADGKSLSTVVFNYSHITANEMNALRTKLAEVNSSIKIVKNTLIKRILDGLKIKTPDNRKETLVGQNALLVSKGQNFILALKVIYEFIKEKEKGAVTFGILNSTVIGASKVEELSKLPSRKELIAHVIGSFTAPLRGFAYTLTGVQNQFVRVLNAIKENKQ